MVHPRLPLGTPGQIWTRQQANGKWAALVSYRDTFGRKHRLQASGPTRPQAVNALRIKVQNFEPNNSLEISPVWTIRQLAEYWLEEVELSDRAEGTKVLYRWNAENLIVPMLGELTIRELSVGRTDRFLKEQLKISVSRARQAKKTLSLMMGLAVRHDAIPSNPVASTSRISKPRNLVEVFSIEHLTLFRRAARQICTAEEGKPGPRSDGQLIEILEVFIGTGARIGEILALRKVDIDLDSEKPQATIRGTVIAPHGKGVIRQDFPKTASSVRTVALPSFTTAALNRRLQAMKDKPDEQTIFHSRSGRPLTTSNVRRWFRQMHTLCEEMAGQKLPPLKPHTFRKTVADLVNDSPLGGLEIAAQQLGNGPETTKAYYLPDKPNIAPPVTAEILEALAPKADEESSQPALQIMSDKSEPQQDED